MGLRNFKNHCKSPRKFKKTYGSLESFRNLLQDSENLKNLQILKQLLKVSVNFRKLKISSRWFRKAQDNFATFGKF